MAMPIADELRFAWDEYANDFYESSAPTGTTGASAQSSITRDPRLADPPADFPRIRATGGFDGRALAVALPIAVLPSGVGAEPGARAALFCPTSPFADRGTCAGNDLDGDASPRSGLGGKATPVARERPQVPCGWGRRPDPRAYRPTTSSGRARRGSIRNAGAAAMPTMMSNGIAKYGVSKPPGTKT